MTTFIKNWINGSSLGSSGGGSSGNGAASTESPSNRFGRYGNNPPEEEPLPGEPPGFRIPVPASAAILYAASGVLLQNLIGANDNDANAEKNRPIHDYWPENNGFVGKPRLETLHKGARIDRYGLAGGRFLAPEGTPVGMRSLSPATNLRDYHAYEVAGPLEALAGKTAPWFGQPGGGTRYQLQFSVQSAIEQGLLKEISP